ncbi:5-formyltetrahydrofolate cyclo-ligase [Lactobacillus sp. S2-2]|uniref:5-formyltetrahydrofolate cyclo-ligase n=1 Tax=Lactobacillus sp. S2-2 TaxID=2692917 RepID=UPI001F0257E1|nr:5-formyltetrahydrofolate cyclo-ligase [Lactobacillus sp. S2-2]MCF6515124.1 5-formyltetrahydrofolate cyclo-ligase [Lactobacillus sp. S2-2]
MNKKEIRNCVQNTMLSKINLDEDNILIKKFINSEKFKNANTVGISISMGDELDTSKLIQFSLDHNKKVVIPKTFSNREMEFYEFNNNTILEKTKFGVLEPVDAQLIFKDNIDLLLVPGLVFNSDNYRIGYGGGFYDKYLSDFKGKTISLVRQFQLIDNIEWNIDSFDIKVDELILKDSIIENN